MANKSILDLDYAKYDFKDPEKYVFKSEKGLSRQTVEQISEMKKEPEWMRKFRLRAYDHFVKRPMPQWGGDLAHIDFNDIYYYLRPTDKVEKSWDDVPDKIKKTFDRLGIPEAEKKFLAGVGAQYESEVVYHSLLKHLEDKGVIFCDTDSAVKLHPELVKKHFGTIIPPEDNKLAALNSAVWSGGCLTAGARVFTSNPGAKSIVDVHSGDSVFALSPDGRLVPASVTAQIFNGRKPVYRLQVAGRNLEATGNHPFLSLQKSRHRLDRFGRKWRTRWVPLRQLRVGDLVAVAKRIPNRSKSRELPLLPRYVKNQHLQRAMGVPDKTSPDLLWLLGILIGDGNIYSPNPNMCFINFALPEGDPARGEAIRLIQSLFNYTVVTKMRNSFTVYSKALGEWLRTIGISGIAKTKRIPDWVFGVPEEERLAFLGGLLDSDGYVEDDGKLVAFEMANLDLIQDIKLLAISCGLFSDGKIRRRKRSSSFLRGQRRQILSGLQFACRISGNVKSVGSRDPRKRAKLDFSEKRTFDKYNTVTGENFSSLTTEDVGFAPIREKVYVGRKDVYDVQVEGYSNFVANGIIAHNSFIYVPEGVKVDLPLQAYFRINAANMGQFERTLIIADNYADVQYIEGCTAPVYSTDALHSAVVEIIAKKGAKVRYTTLQNWSSDVYNLVTKRAYAYEDATVEWIDANVGSKLTMKYPSVYLVGPRAKAEIVSVAFAGKDRHQDTGAKAVHLAPYTSSRITAKSVSKDGGLTTYRGLVHVAKGAVGVKSSVRCDALLMDDRSKTTTYPYMEVNEDDATITHEATVGRINEDQLFYLMSRGLSETQALSMIVTGFMEPFTRVLPMEYAVEFNRLIEMEMEGAVG